MEEVEMNNFDENEIENYSRAELTNYFNDIYVERSRLYKRYGDNDKTPEDIRVKYREYDSILNKIEEQRDKNEETSFTDNDNGKTVKITGPGGEIDVPSVGIVKKYRSQVTYDKKANIKKVFGNGL